MIIRSAIFLIAACCAVCLHGCNSSNSSFPVVSPGTASGGATDGKQFLGVLEHHNGPRRDGVYIDSSLTRSSASTFHIDPGFKAAVSGSIYAQLLFSAAGLSGRDLIIAVSESNDVAALDAATGAEIWKRNLGAPVPLSQLPCGNIDPLGITGTPVIHPASAALFVDAMTTPDNGTTLKHLVFALSLADGSVLPGWPVDVSASVSYNGLGFDSSLQNQRGALAFRNGILYVPYGGHYGDCGDYRGWLVGIPARDPAAPRAWATAARGGGSWAPSGVSSDGVSLFIATGNTFGASTWSGGEAILRFNSGPAFSGQPADYFTPANWQELDAGDIDIGGTGPIVLDLPGAVPSKLLVGLGKDGKLYLVNRENLGGIGNPVAVAQVSNEEIINAAAAYATKKGTYVVFKGNGSSCPQGQSGELTAVRIIPGNPPAIKTAWCTAQNGQGSPMVTTTDGRNEAIVWSVGAEGDNRLHGFDGDTGEVVYAGGGPDDVIGQVRRYHTPILARGRIYIAADGAVKVFVR